jgi:hypothetical protein
MQELIDPGAAARPPTMAAQTFCLLIFPQGVLDEVVAILDDMGVPGFTETEKVVGRGPRGRHFDNAVWPGADSSIYSVLSAQQANALGAAMLEFNNQLEQRSRGLFGLRMFTWSCHQVV